MPKPVREVPEVPAARGINQRSKAIRRSSMRWFGSLEKLAGLPVRHQEERYGKPVASDGNIERGRKQCACARQHTAAKGTTASSVIFHRRRTGKG